MTRCAMQLRGLVANNGLIQSLSKALNIFPNSLAGVRSEGAVRGALLRVLMGCPGRAMNVNERMSEGAPCRQFNARTQGCSRSYARSSGQCRQPVAAAPNPGSPDTSYGVAGARDCRGCDQAPCSETAQKIKKW